MAHLIGRAVESLTHVISLSRGGKRTLPAAQDPSLCHKWADVRAEGGVWLLERDWVWLSLHLLGRRPSVSAALSVTETHGCTFICLLCCNNKGPQISWPRTTEINRLPVLEARCPKSRCRQGWFLLRAVRKGSAPGLFLWLVELSSPASLHRLPSMCVSVQISPFWKVFSYIGLGPILTTSF